MSIARTATSARYVAQKDFLPISGLRRYASVSQGSPKSKSPWVPGAAIVTLVGIGWFVQKESKATQVSQGFASDTSEDRSGSVKYATRKAEEDGKGKKIRIDSALRTPQGEASEESKIRREQRGISNAPTMHSTDQMENPGQSKKPEGTPDSAKSTGTIDPQRAAKYETDAVTGAGKD